MSKPEAIRFITKKEPISVGIEILSRHNIDPYFLRLCKLNPAKYRKDLEAKLRELYSITAIVQPSERPKVVTAAKRFIVDVEPIKVSLRSEFPFLSAPDCPMQLHSLVAYKLSAYHLYKAAHAKLFDCTTIEDSLHTATDVVLNYIENTSIYKELNHYKKHNVLLGEHPIFEHYQKLGSLQKLSTVDLIEKRTKLKHNIWRIENNISKEPNSHLNVSRAADLKKKIMELSEVHRLLNIKE